MVGVFIALMSIVLAVAASMLTFNIITRHHRGRRITAFEYAQTNTSSGTQIRTTSMNRVLDNVPDEVWTQHRNSLA